MLYIFRHQRRPLGMDHELFRFLEYEMESVLDVACEECRRTGTKRVERERLCDFLDGFRGVYTHHLWRWHGGW